MKRQGMWVEVTTLVIPGVNDGEAELRDIARFMAGELGPETPWHISRFFPTYKLVDSPPTPVETLRRAADLGREAGLVHVYVGNVGSEGVTSCPACGGSLIRRLGFAVAQNAIRDGACPHCGRPDRGNMELSVGQTAEQVSRNIRN